MADRKTLKGGLNLVKRLFASPDMADDGMSLIRSAGRTAHEQEAAIRAARDAEVAEQMASLPARNKKANEAAGLYHPVGGGIKLSKPTRGMHSTTVADPKFNPPNIGIITPEQLVKEEAALFPLVGDRAAAGRYLTHVDENELEMPVRLTGGSRYMDANYNHLNPEDSAAWESGLGRVTALGRQAERAGTGGRPVYGIYTAGSGTNTDFNVMGANALIQQIPFSKITKKAEKAFDQAMREGSKEFAPVPNWPGIRSPEAQNMLLDKSNGIVRTKLFGTMGKENFQSMGFPDVPATRKAIIEPELLDVPTNQAGFRLARMDTSGRIIENPNIPSDYPTAMAGKVAGRLDVPADYKDVFQSHFDARRLLGQPESGDYYSFSRAHPIQYADDEWLNRLMEQRLAAERKIKEGEYKEGGEATKEPSALEKIQAKIKATIHEHHMAAGGGAFKTMKFDKGGKASTVKAAMDVGKRLFSQDVLPAAEYEANLAKMMSKSAVKDRLYHGTTEDIQRFDSSKAGTKTKNLTTALGTFLSNNPAEASRYAKDWGTQGGNVMPVFAQVEKPYQMPYNEFEGLAMGAWNRMMKDPSFDPNAVVKWNDIEGAKRAAAAVNKHEPDALQDVINRRNELISQGHDAVIVNIGGNKEVIVFDPAKIKSAIGNRGTFDTSSPDLSKAHGGLTRAFAGGGITTGAGSFSPEDVGMTAAEMNAPAIPAYVKQNASKLMDEGRAQLEKEYSQLKTPQGRADFIKRLGTALVGSPHDMLHMGLELGDYIQTKIPSMSKPESVMLPSDTKDRVPKVSLADLHTTKEGDVYGGSSGFNTELKKLKFLGENEFPLMELPTMLFGPAVASKAGRGIKSLASKAK